MPATPNSKIAGSYQRLSLAEKQALQRERMREPAVACPVCETQTTAADLLDHIATRCPGPREPNPASKWVTWRQALAMGAARSTMNKWVTLGRVHVRGELQAREYLLRDVVICVARVRQRRQFTKVNRPVPPGSAAPVGPNNGDYRGPCPSPKNGEGSGCVG